MGIRLVFGMIFLKKGEVKIRLCREERVEVLSIG